jgi:xanthine dehydrogenase YagR molybdenum-binding subunit
VRVDYARSDGAFDLAAAPRPASRSPASDEPDTAVGDFAAAFASAPVKLDATYTTPDQAHAMMEPHASIAAWEWRQLTRLDVQPDDRMVGRPTWRRPSVCPKRRSG